MSAALVPGMFRRCRWLWVRGREILVFGGPGCCHRQNRTQRMTNTRMRRESDIAVIVMERGAVWPSCVDACRRITPDTVILAQDDDESCEMLGRRVRARLEALRREGRPVRAGVVAVSRRADAETFESRASVARSLLRALDESMEVGTLWLSAPHGIPEAARHHLIALAGTLTGLAGASDVVVAVRFADRRNAESGESATRARVHVGADRPLATAS